MEKTGYILLNSGLAIAIIIADDNELKEKVATAIKEEVVADEEGQFELTIGDIGDWGEDTDIKVSYVSNGSLIRDDEFNLRKSVTY